MPNPAIAPTIGQSRAPSALPTTPSRSRAACWSHTASPSLYIADLDAIAGVGNHFELVARAELRASRHRIVDRCRLLRCRRLRLLAAARGDAGDRQRESRRGRGLARHSFGVRREGRAFARFRRRRPERPRRAVRRSSLWPLRVIAMDLSRVGTESRPRSDGINRWSAWPIGRAIFAAGGIGTRAISKRSPLCGRMARCSPRRCIAMPSRKMRSPPSRESGDPSKSVHTPNRQKPSFWSHRRIGPGPGLPVFPRPGGSPFQPAANGW